MTSGSLAGLDHLNSLQVETQILFPPNPVVNAAKPNARNWMQSLQDLLPASIEKLELDISGWSSSNFYKRLGIWLPALANAHMYNELLPHLNTVNMFLV